MSVMYLDNTAIRPVTSRDGALTLIRGRRNAAYRETPSYDVTGFEPLQRLDWLGRRLLEPLPPDFQWNYRDSASCALGLYDRETGRYPTSDEFAIDPAEHSYIFINFNVLFPVRPQTIARRIRKVLKRNNYSPVGLPA